MRYSRLGRRRLGVIVVMMLLVSLLTPLTALAAPAQHSSGNTQWVQVYTVQYGDTLTGIAASFGVSAQALMDANSLHNPNQIYVGQQLIIPADQSQGTGGPECDSYYTVRYGDTLSEIALYHGVDQDYLAHVNAIYDDNDIYVGQSLCIPSQQSGNEYPQQHQQPAQQPEQPAQQPEQPTQQPQQPAQQPQNSQNDSCGSCGQQPAQQPQQPAQQPQQPAQQSQNSQNDSCGSCGQSQNNGDQHNNQQCDSCGQPQDTGSQNNNQSCDTCGQQNSTSQNNGDHPDNQQCNSCGQPQNPQSNGSQNDSQDCGSCGQQNNGAQNDGAHQDNQSCNCDGQGSQLQPTDFWKGDYYNDKYFTKFFQTRQDLDVNFNWFTGAPIEGMNKDRFSVRWEKVASFKGGPTRFHAVADDGVRVYVDDQLIIDHWVIEPATEYTADVNLSPGPHKVVVEYYEEAENAVIHVFWEPIDHHDQNDNHDNYN